MMTDAALDLQPGIAACIRLITAGVNDRPFFLAGIAGGSCSGKSYIAHRIASAVNGTCLPMDDYYVGRDRMSDDNFDDPAAIELSLLKDHLARLREGQPITKPVYDFSRSERTGTEAFRAGRIILVDGLFALHENLRPLYGLKVFVEAEEAVRFTRRLERDTTVRRIVRDQVIRQWRERVCPSHGRWVAPQCACADLIIRNN